MGIRPAPLSFPLAFEAVLSVDCLSLRDDEVSFAGHRGLEGFLAAPPTLSVQRVVVMDTDEAAAFKVVQILSAEGFRVTTAIDPRAFLALTSDEVPDLLIVDLGLQLLDVVPRWERRKGDPEPGPTHVPLTAGYAVLRPLSAEPATARHVAVVLAGSRDLPARTATPRFALVGCVPKPVTRSVFLPRLQALVRSVRIAGRLRAPVPISWNEAAGELEKPLLADDPLSDWGDEEPFSSLPRPLRRALLLDADEGYRGFLHDLLEGFGFTVHEAADPDAALELALAKRPWLIITDALMPAGAGFEFCRAARNHSLLARTPLFFVSARDGLQERYRALKLGADDYLSKGASTRELLIRLQLLLKRYSDLGGPVRPGTSLAGGIEIVGAPGLLQMCHLSRLTGILTTRHMGRVAKVNFRRGEVIGAESGRLKGPAAFYDVVAWLEGHFEFQTQNPGEGPPMEERFDHLLLEGCRLLDEAQGKPKRVAGPSRPAPKVRNIVS